MGLMKAPFTFQAVKGGKVLISREGRVVTVLARARAEKFLREAAGADAEALQLLLARVTGHYRHGNERP